MIETVIAVLADKEGGGVESLICWDAIDVIINHLDVHDPFDFVVFP